MWIKYIHDFSPDWISPAAPLPYLQANCLALCEGPGILGMGWAGNIIGNQTANSWERTKAFLGSHIVNIKKRFHDLVSYCLDGFAIASYPWRKTTILIDLCILHPDFHFFTDRWGNPWLVPQIRKLKHPRAVHKQFHPRVLTWLLQNTSPMNPMNSHGLHAWLNALLTYKKHAAQQMEEIVYLSIIHGCSGSLPCALWLPWRLGVVLRISCRCGGWDLLAGRLNLFSRLTLWTLWGLVFPFGLGTSLCFLFRLSRLLSAVLIGTLGTTLEVKVLAQLPDQLVWNRERIRRQLHIYTRTKGA